MTRLPAWFLRAWLVRASAGSKMESSHAKYSRILQNISNISNIREKTLRRQEVGRGVNGRDMTLPLGLIPLFRGWRKNHDQEE